MLQSLIWYKPSPSWTPSKEFSYYRTKRTLLQGSPYSLHPRGNILARLPLTLKLLDYQMFGRVSGASLVDWLLWALRSFQSLRNNWHSSK